jgi:hypothetical protein
VEAVGTIARFYEESYVRITVDLLVLQMNKSVEERTPWAERISSSR